MCNAVFIGCSFHRKLVREEQQLLAFCHSLYICQSAERSRERVMSYEYIQQQCVIIFWVLLGMVVLSTVIQLVLFTALIQLNRRILILHSHFSAAERRNRYGQAVSNLRMLALQDWSTEILFSPTTMPSK